MRKGWYGIDDRLDENLEGYGMVGFDRLHDTEIIYRDKTMDNTYYIAHLSESEIKEYFDSLEDGEKKVLFYFFGWTEDADFFMGSPIQQLSDLLSVITIWDIFDKNYYKGMTLEETKAYINEHNTLCPNCDKLVNKETLLVCDECDLTYCEKCEGWGDGGSLCPVCNNQK